MDENDMTASHLLYGTMISRKDHTQMPVFTLDASNNKESLALLLMTLKGPKVERNFCPVEGEQTT